MQNMTPRVVVLGTGGTIAGLAASPSEQVAYRSAQVGIDDLVKALPVAGGAVVETEQVAQLDSKDMDFATWRTLAQRTAHHLARPEVSGIVITHGTDTLEETAYFLARVVAAAKPVVLTGAMRPASSSEADGPRNLGDAIALAGQAQWHGVVVALAGSVHTARDVKKMHSQRLDAFSSGDQGTLARIEAGQIRLLRPLPAGAEALGVDLLPADASAWPWVEIVTRAAGAEGRIVELLVQAGADGIVVAGTGNGTVHARLNGAAVAAGERGVRLLRATRCLDGGIVEGGASTLTSAADLTPAKARVELILTLLAERREVGAGLLKHECR